MAQSMQYTSISLVFTFILLVYTRFNVDEAGEQFLCRQLQLRESESPAERDLWIKAEVEHGWIDETVVATRPKSANVKNRPRIAAVEVDPAGCSYNPDYEQHQDAVAVAVAAENMKLIDRELEPKVCLLEAWQCWRCI